MSLRRGLFQLHSWLGICLGVVLGIMGFSGAMLAFREEIVAWLDPAVVQGGAAAAAAPGGRLTASELVAHASAQRAGLPVLLLVTYRDPRAAPRVFFAPVAGRQASLAPSYVDPASGALLGQARGEAFFDGVESVHRWLALPGRDKGAGATITGIAAAAMLGFALSGLYLRWPRRPLQWREWLRLDLRGRGLVAGSWTLHRVVGTWVLLAYLFSASTGLWFAFDGYRRAAAWVLGTSLPQPPATATASRPPEPMQPRAIDAALRQVGATSRTGYHTVMMRLPLSGGPIHVSALPEGNGHGTLMDEFEFDASDGALQWSQRHEERSAGEVMVKSPVYVHIGSLFGLPGRLVLFAAALVLPLFPVSGWIMFLARRRRARPR